MNCITGCPCDDYECDTATTTIVASTTTEEPVIEKSVLVLSSWNGNKHTLVNFEGNINYTTSSVILSFSSYFVILKHFCENQLFCHRILKNFCKKTVIFFIIFSNYNPFFQKIGKKRYFVILKRKHGQNNSYFVI